MIFPGFLNIIHGPSQSGKTTYTLNLLSKSSILSVLGINQIVVYSFKGDEQFVQFKEKNVCPISIRSYDDGGFDPDSVPDNSALILDEISQALLRDEGNSIIKGIKNILTTRGHHSNIATFCLMQNILGTKSYSLLSLAHGITLNPMQNSNLDLLKYLPIHKSISKQVQKHFLSWQVISPESGIPWVTLFYNPPYKYQVLSNCVSSFFPPCENNKKDIFPRTIITSMHAPMASAKEKGNEASSRAITYRFRDNAKKAFEPLFERAGLKTLTTLDGGGEGLLILPTTDVEISQVSQDSSKTAGKKREATENAVDRAFRDMVVQTVAANQRAKYQRVWYFLKKCPSLKLDPKTFIISDMEAKHSINLAQLIGTILRSNQLKKQKGAKDYCKDSLYITSLLLKEKSFNPAVIANKSLLKAAKAI